MAKYKQLVYPDMGTRDGPGWCLRFTQTAFRAPVAHPTARVAWDHQKGRHFDTPPLGIRVPIWLDHHGSYGSPPRWDNFGHVAVWLGDGRVLSSPMNAWQGGQVIFGSIREMIAALGNGKYLGWSEYMNGKQIVEKVQSSKPESKPSGQEADEEVIFIRKSKQDSVWAFSPATGKKRKVGTTEWNTLQRAYSAAGLKLPLTNLTASEAKYFGV